jgi:uncharacterized membrane protein YhdT
VGVAGSVGAEVAKVARVAVFGFGTAVGVAAWIVVAAGSGAVLGADVADSWMWMACLALGVRPLMSATMRTPAGTWVKRTTPAVVLPLVGCMTATSAAGALHSMSFAPAAPWS